MECGSLLRQPWKAHAVISTISHRSHRLVLIQCGRGLHGAGAYAETLEVTLEIGYGILSKPFPQGTLLVPLLLLIPMAQDMPTQEMLVHLVPSFKAELNTWEYEELNRLY